MGNMGYPVVTRLGMNQFWTKHWYVEHNSPEAMQHDKIFEKLLLTYLNYGLSAPRNLFFHSYFFSYQSKKLSQLNTERQKKYFRSFFYSNTVLTIEHSYLIRNTSSEYFPMRLWHIKYNGWVLLAFNCFRPLKQKKKLKLFSKNSGSGAFASSLTKKPSTRTINRFKLIYMLMRKHFLRDLNYIF